MSINDIDFIARHYRRGLFSTKEAWRRMGISPWRSWRRFRAAAAIGAAVILSATAAVVFTQYRTADESPLTEQSTIPTSPLAVVKVIDFEDAPLPEVVKKIENLYGVKVEGLPANPEAHVLTLRYEGTPADLIAAINDILGTHMTVTEP